MDAMGWIDPDGEFVDICQGLKQRHKREKIRVKSAASDFRLQSGRVPSGQAKAIVIP